MINQVNKFEVSAILPVENPIKYIIPKFQRSYTWRKDNWEALVSDILESEDSHFIGSIICINPGSESLSPELEIIDGQQRLTTISLLFCAIYKKLKEKSDETDDSKFLLNSLKNKLVIGNSVCLELSSQNNNFSDYQAILNELGIISFEDNAKNRGNRAIFKCYRFYLSYVEDYSKEQLQDLLNRLNRTLLVKIEVDSHSDAFMLFESLNNRGMPLSAVDLIKNKMLAELDSKEAMSADDAFNKWKNIITNLPDYSIQERFLRHFYNTYKFENEGFKISGITIATKSNLIKIYEHLIEKKPEIILDDLIEKSEIYSGLTDPEDADREPYDDLSKPLLDLVHVKAASAYILLLYIFSRPRDFEISSYREIISFLVKYFIRRNITDFPSTRNLDRIFMELVKNLQDDESKRSAEYIISFLSDKDRMSRLETFRERLNGDIYDLNVDATRFVLAKIEESRSTKETYTDFWAREKGKKLVWTIEHIFPEGRNIPSAWVKMIADGDRLKAEKIQEDWVHKLGNLTLTGYNSKLSNFDFKKKRDRKKGKNSIGYKNGLFLNESLEKKDRWTKEDIKDRTEKLVDIAIEIFKMEKE